MVLRPAAVLCAFLRSDDIAHEAKPDHAVLSVLERWVAENGAAVRLHTKLRWNESGVRGVRVDLVTPRPFR